MKGLTAIVKKEVSTYFSTPTAYVAIAVFMFIMGIIFISLLSEFQRRALMFLQAQRTDLLEQINVTDMIAMPVIGNMAVWLIILVPVITMRLFAEEKRMGTYEFLMTAPVSTFEIVMGKYLSALFVILIMLVLTLFYPITLHVFALGDSGSGSGVEWNTVFSAYLGVFLIGAAVTAMGLFMSSITNSQIIAAVLTVFVAFLLWLLKLAANILVTEGPLHEILSYISLLDHMLDFAKGLIQAKSLVYYSSVIFFSLFLTYRAIEMDRYA